MIRQRVGSQGEKNRKQRIEVLGLSASGKWDLTSDLDVFTRTHMQS